MFRNNPYYSNSNGSQIAMTSGLKSSSSCTISGGVMVSQCGDRITVTNKNGEKKSYTGHQVVNRKGEVFIDGQSIDTMEPMPASPRPT